MRFNDAIIGVVLLIFGSAIVIHSRSFPGLPGQNYGPAFFPTIIGVALAICGCVFIVQGYLKRREAGLVTLGEWASSPRHRANFILVIVGLVVYVLVSDFVGFIPTAIAITTVLTVRFGVRVWSALAISTLATFVIHTAFYKILLVPLPWGLLEPIAW